MIDGIIKKGSAKDISNEVLDKNGKVKLMTASEWTSFPWNDFRLFCHFYARYGIPTIELVEFLYDIIKDKLTIEIGAGTGDLGYHLRIPMTDSRQQEMPEVIKAYKNMQQPVIIYPDEVRKFDAIDAIRFYKPDIVIASWISPYSPCETYYKSNPFGVKVEKVVDMVERFILLGNIDSHGDMPIMKLNHQELYAEWMVSRAKNQENNRIWIWSNL